MAENPTSQAELIRSRSAVFQHERRRNVESVGITSFYVDESSDLDAIDLRNQLRQFINGYALEPVKDYDGLIANLERVEHEIKQLEQNTKDLPPTPISPRMTPELFAIMEGRERFTTIHAPARVIMAGTEREKPDPVTGDDPQSRAGAARQVLDMRQLCQFADRQMAHKRGL